jgi:hypothetical protein
MPELHVLCTCNNQSLQQEEEVLKIKLYLPSSITMPTNIVCDIWLHQIEWDLYQAQVHNALHELHDGLHLYSYIYIDKDCFQHGQYLNICSQDLVNYLETKINAAAEKYRTTQQAISVLALPLCQMGWE